MLRFIELTKAARAAGPGADAAIELENFLKVNPWIADHIGGLRTLAENHIFKNFSDRSESITMRREMKNLRDRLGYQNSSQLEQMIIGQVVLGWAMSQIAAATCSMAGGGSNSEFWDRRHSRAEARMLRATESLIRIRRLLLL